MKNLMQHIMEILAQHSAQNPATESALMASTGADPQDFQQALQYLNAAGKISSAQYCRPRQSSAPWTVIWPNGVITKRPVNGQSLSGLFVPHPPMREALRRAFAPRTASVRAKA